MTTGGKMKKGKNYQDKVKTYDKSELLIWMPLWLRSKKWQLPNSMKPSNCTHA